MPIESVISAAEKPKKKILLVDDDASQTEAIKDFFEISSLADKYCLTIITASDGEEALSLYNSDKSIDAVITDYNMPKKDGITLIKELRASGYLGLIYSLSGSLDNDIPQKFTEAGATRQFTKPCDPEKLAAHLEKDLMPKLVMIVDDESSLAHGLSKMLERKGFETVVFYDGQPALDYFNSVDRKPDAVLTDNSMPNLTGIKLVEALRASGYRGIIYAMSGDGDDIITKLKDAGATRAYKKPVRFSHILPELSADLSPKQNL